jgi:hypothetical protein
VCRASPTTRSPSCRARTTRAGRSRDAGAPAGPPGSRSIVPSPATTALGHWQGVPLIEKLGGTPLGPFAVKPTSL